MKKKLVGMLIFWQWFSERQCPVAAAARKRKEADK